MPIPNLGLVPIAIAAGIAVLLWLMWGRRRTAAPTAYDELPGLAAMVKNGEYGKAAALARGRNKLDVALELYLRAQQPENAAAVAAQLNDSKQAAELYERAKNWERAAHFYSQAGMAERAEQLRREHHGRKTNLARAPGAPAPAPAISRGRELEAEFRAASATADTSESHRAKLQSMAHAAANALLAEGDIRRAADVFRDADLDDEAIHLYVNVLGEPGLAAPLLARRGNHERAAELYELAGETQRAATTWVEVARLAQRPEIFLDRIERLSRDVATAFLDQEVRRRPLDTSNAELFYRFAQGLAKRGDSQPAIDMYRRLREVVGAYKDIDSQIELLVSGKHPMDARAQPQTTAASAAATATAAFPALAAAQIHALAEQVAKAAAEQIQRQSKIEFTNNVTVGAAPAATAALATGLESGSIKVELLFDPAVRAARGGPSVDTLQGFIAGRECDLQNIEVYYRLGLVYLAQGKYQEALAAFDAVEEASAGYRDAWKRADEVRSWQRALGKRATRLGTSPTGTSRYEIHGELGRGGMAVVYRGRDSVLGREVALKFLSESLSAKSDMQELFQREARSVAALNHPNIITIHDVGVLEGRAFICMEYVDGRSLESLMSQSPGLTIVESLRAVKQVLDGLGYAHSRKIIHRDIKPANIMRSASGLVKLMDFGLAKSLDGVQQASMIAGTPQFMALEQLRGEHVDHRADLFAIGVTLYELLSGRAPYEGLDRTKTPVEITEHVPAIPGVLADAIMCSLSNDPSKRPQSAADLVGPLIHVLDAVSRAAGVTATLGEPSSGGPASG